MLRNCMPSTFGEEFAIGNYYRRAVARLTNISYGASGGGGHLPSLPDASYGPAIGNCLKKLDPISMLSIGPCQSSH